MPLVRTCAVCKLAKQTFVKGSTEPVDGVTRYSLYRRYKNASGKSCQWGRGGIDLCDECWGKYAKPNRRAKKDR